MKTIHIEGRADELNLKGELSSNYDLDVSLMFGEESTDIIKNVFVRFYESDEKCTLDTAVEKFLKKIYGDLEVVGAEYKYSEYTVEGFDITSLKLGGHDLDKIIKSKKKKYLHILIDQVPTKERK